MSRNIEVIIGVHERPMSVRATLSLKIPNENPTILTPQKTPLRYNFHPPVRRIENDAPL